MNLQRTFVAAALAALSLGAQAQTSTGGYLSLGGGVSRWNVDCSDTLSCDKGDTALRVAAGYRFANGLALEALYLGLGKTTASVGTFQGVVTAELKATAAGGGLAVFMPIGPNAELTARLGAASVSAKATGRLGSGPNIDAGDERKTKFYAGLGLGYSFSPTVQLQLHYESTRVEAFGDDGQVGAVTVGIGLRF